MSFYDLYKDYKDINFNLFFKGISDIDILNILEKDRLEIEDFLRLLSPQAGRYLEEMAQKAHHLTIKNFGKVIFLYTPLYLSNYCVNNCSYCGFNVNHDYERKKLTIEEVGKEAEVIAEKGIRDILILTGESRKHSPISYIKDCVRVLKNHFTSIGVEVYPLTKAEYQELVSIGVDGLTIYQEVYNEVIYDQVHISGPKKDYHYRLDAAERGCQAGIRRINIGSLLGLDDWEKEAFFAGLHAWYLQKKYIDMEISLSVPRLRLHPGGISGNFLVENRDLVQVILAYRLFMPRIGINLSTREPADLRDNLLSLGITKVSAESTTIVGGYSDSNGTAQFEIADQRRITDIKNIIAAKGYQAVFQDWHYLDIDDIDIMSN